MFLLSDARKKYLLPSNYLLGQLFNTEGSDVMKKIERMLTIFLILVLCIYGQRASSLDEALERAIARGEAASFPLARVVEDARPPIHIDPTKPFVVGLGRGSGWHGLDTVRITEKGTVDLYRQYDEKDTEGVWHQRWERGHLQIPEDAVQALFDALSTYHLLTLHKAYYADVHDGTQWVFFVRQDRTVKSVYCDNHFPENLLAFAEWLDALLTQHRLDEVTWETVPEANGRTHEDEFWEWVTRQ